MNRPSRICSSKGIILLAGEPGPRVVSGEEEGDEELSGHGVVFPGPFRDQRSHRRIGGEDAVVSALVDAGRGRIFSRFDKLNDRSAGSIHFALIAEATRPRVV